METPSPRSSSGAAYRGRGVWPRAATRLSGVALFLLVVVGWIERLQGLGDNPRND
jgi:hypothetical protein